MGGSALFNVVIQIQRREKHKVARKSRTERRLPGSTPDALPTKP